MNSNENCIEFLTGKQSATITFSSRKHINKIKKLYGDDNWKDSFSYFHENEDGSICAKIPVKWIRISPGSKTQRNLTEEQKEELRARMRRINRKKPDDNINDCE